MGRLFDAAAALLGICVYASFEAEGPTKLEALCDAGVKERYRFSVVEENGCCVIDMGNVFEDMLRDLQQGKDQRLIATKFHNTMIVIVVDMAKRFNKAFGVRDVALSGGVFQNIFLRTRAVKQLADAGLNVWRNVNMPASDLNIALGQYHVSCSTGEG